MTNADAPQLRHGGIRPSPLSSANWPGDVETEGWRPSGRDRVLVNAGGTSGPSRSQEGGLQWWQTSVWLLLCILSNLGHFSGSWNTECFDFLPCVAATAGGWCCEVGPPPGKLSFFLLHQTQLLLICWIVLCWDVLSCVVLYRLCHI